MGHAAGDMRVVIPKRIIILLSGIPATGKSEFGRYLARKRGFAHYDMECSPRGWPHPELKQKWDTDVSAFIEEALKTHGRVALDWGFPVSCVSFVRQLQALGVRLIWFDGDIPAARKIFMQRGGIDVKLFDKQVKEVKEAGFPDALHCMVIEALSARGAFLDGRQIEGLVFSRSNDITGDRGRAHR